MEPYSIEILVPNGDPEGVRIVSLKNWTGVGVAFPRQEWKSTRDRSEFDQTGVYILSGYYDVVDSDSPNESELPVLYIGQTDDLRSRINQHDKGNFFSIGR